MYLKELERAVESNSSVDVQSLDEQLLAYL